VWAVYTPHTHTYKKPRSSCKKERFCKEEVRQALGIISGGATIDNENSDRIIARESCFPYELIKKAISIKVEDAMGSVDEDRIRILNSIVGNSVWNSNGQPATSHKKYIEVNNTLRAIFASSTASIQGAAKEGGEEWKKMLDAIAKGTMRDNMVFDFDPDGIWGRLTAVQATELVAHLPLTIELLRIDNAQYSIEFMDAMIDRLKIFHNLHTLRIHDTLVCGKEGGKEAGLRLADVLATNITITELRLFGTDLIGTENVEQWGDALMKNTALRWLELSGVDREIVDHLKMKTKNRRLELRIKTSLCKKCMLTPLGQRMISRKGNHNHD